MQMSVVFTKKKMGCCATILWSDGGGQIAISVLIERIGFAVRYLMGGIRGPFFV